MLAATFLTPAGAAKRKQRENEAVLLSAKAMEKPLVAPAAPHQPHSPAL